MIAYFIDGPWMHQLRRVAGGEVFYIPEEDSLTGRRLRRYRRLPAEFRLPDGSLVPAYELDAWLV